jgi:MYXO-CTERM domain-containing protein
VVGAAPAAPVQGQPNFVSPGNYYSGVVDDLEMFVMGLNASRSFGEWVFETDNDFAAAFKPTTAGDLNNDGDITLADAQTFATNWLYEKRLSWTDFRGAAQSLRVGDLESRGRGDFNYDGIVDLRDWAVLNNASPSMATVAMQLIQAVPEPSSAVVALLGLAMAGWRRRG